MTAGVADYGCLPSYDCFYLKSGGEFKGNGDGGFINVSGNSNPEICS